MNKSVKSGDIGEIWKSVEIWGHWKSGDIIPILTDPLVKSGEIWGHNTDFILTDPLITRLLIKGN